MGIMLLVGRLYGNDQDEGENLLGWEWDRFWAPGEGAGLLELIRGYGQAIFFEQAFRTGIFDCLTEEPNDAKFFAAKMGCPSDRVEYLLDALAAIELVEKEGEFYRIAPLAARCLRRGSPYYIGDLIDMEFASRQRESWGMLGEWLKGKTINCAHHPRVVFQPSFVKAMAQAVLSDNSVAQTAGIISSHPCFAVSHNVLDLGGGHGLYSLALLNIKSDLNITVFDLPQVKTVTFGYAQVFGREPGFQPGDFYKDELPCNQDIVLAFDILHPVPGTQKEEVFKKVHKALNTGGYLFYKTWFLDETRTKPRRGALFALKSKITNDASHVYTFSEAKIMLERVGFRVEDRLFLDDGCSSILVACKKRTGNKQ